MIDRVKKLTNVSSKPIQVQHLRGLVSIIPSGGILENVQITNLMEIKHKVAATLDLTEVKEPHSKTKING